MFCKQRFLSVLHAFEHLQQQQHFFQNKVSYVHQLEKKLMNSNNKVADQESKWEKFQLFCRGSENYNPQKLISYFIVVIVPKQSLYQPLFMYSRKCILCTCLVVYWYRCSSACLKTKQTKTTTATSIYFTYIFVKQC